MSTGRKGSLSFCSTEHIHKCVCLDTHICIYIMNLPHILIKTNSCLLVSNWRSKPQYPLIYIKKLKQRKENLVTNLHSIGIGFETHDSIIFLITDKKNTIWNTISFPFIEEDICHAKSRLSYSEKKKSCLSQYIWLSLSHKLRIEVMWSLHNWPLGFQSLSNKLKYTSLFFCKLRASNSNLSSQWNYNMHSHEYLNG